MSSKKSPRLQPRDAASWFVRHFEGETNQREQAAFNHQLENDAELEQDYGRCDLAVSLLEELRDDEDLAPAFGNAAFLARRYRSARQRRRVLTGVAAAIVVSLISTFAAILIAPTNEPMVYATTVGEQRTIVLPDQSLVRLNTDSHMIVDYKDTERRIRLEQGEAIFDVKRDPTRPFKVLAANGIAVAVGTKFNVLAQRNRATVTVIEGKVQVIPAGQLGPALHRIAAIQQPTLTQGETVTYEDSGKIDEVSVGNTERIEAWQEGKLAFSNMRLEDAVAEHNRYTALKIVIGDDALNAKLVSGVLRIGDTTSLIFLLEQTLDVRATRRGNQIVLVPVGTTSAAKKRTPMG